MKKNIRYFDNPETLEDLKKQYRELAFKHHPDRGRKQ
jgi:curved DNA-binding protein CbpA